TVHNSLGAAYGNMGRTGEAIDHFRRAVELQPSYRDALANLATVYASIGRDAEAIDLFQRTIRLDPVYAPAHHGLAMSYLRLGETDGARSEYRVLVRLGSPLASEVAAALREHGAPVSVD